MTVDTDPDTSTVVKTKPVDPSTETKPAPGTLPQPTIEVQFTETQMSQDEQNAWKFQKLARATGISLLTPHEEQQAKKDADAAEKEQQKIEQQRQEDEEAAAEEAESADEPESKKTPATTKSGK